MALGPVALMRPFSLWLLRRTLVCGSAACCHSWTASAGSNDQLVANLQRDQGLSPASVTALSRVDRANFLPRDLLRNAYEDRPLPIGHGVTISAPHMHAVALEVLLEELQPGAAVLDVGVGSGFLAAAFAEMVGPAGSVLGIDRVPALVAMSETNLRRHDASLLASGRVRFALADGWASCSEGGPFDAIHVGAAAASMPAELVAQLKPGGRMMIPIGPEGGNQVIVQVDKDAAGRVHRTSLMGVRYVPLVKGVAGQR